MTNQERYEELKAIPYVKRNGAQRTEFDQLKTQFEGSSTAMATPAQEETITVKKSSLEALMSRVENLEKTNTSNERKLGLQAAEGKWVEQEDKQRVHTARFRVYRETASSSPSIVVDWHYERDRWNIDKHVTEQMYILTLQDPDGKKSNVEVTLSDFAKISDYVIVQILRQDVKNLVKVDGYVRKRNVKDDYSVEEGEQVPFKVTEQKTTCHVKLPMDAPWGGYEFDIDASRLNA